uniref:Uncharacterized protein n=1 Tax=Pinctada fucata TaxID=50426 RepID=A0A194AQC2_PINFU
MNTYLLQTCENALVFYLAKLIGLCFMLEQQLRSIHEYIDIIFMLHFRKRFILFPYQVVIWVGGGVGRRFASFSLYLIIFKELEHCQVAYFLMSLHQRFSITL